MIKIEDLQTIKGDAYEYYNSNESELDLFNKVFLAGDVLEQIKDPRSILLLAKKVLVRQHIQYIFRNRP